MVRGLRYLADKIEMLHFYLITKWNNFLNKIKM